MADELNAAIEQLERKLEGELRTANETKKAINLLLKMVGRAPKFADSDMESANLVLRPDQFYGKPLATAVTEFLESKKQAVQPEEIMRGLEAGGFDFDVAGWKEGDRLRSLAISLAKNTVKFIRLKNGSFGLKSWYDADFLKKAAKQKQASAEEPIAEEELAEADQVAGAEPEVVRAKA